MNSFTQLKRPYDYRGLIEAYIYTQRVDFANDERFANYYLSLLDALQVQFGIALSHEYLATTEKKVFWMHFQNTVRSLLKITSPWSGYLDDSLLSIKLENNPALNHVVNQAARIISKANNNSELAHRKMLEALFQNIFGPCERIVTSADLLAAGFDDSLEPTVDDYYDNM